MIYVGLFWRQLKEDVYNNKGFQSSKQDEQHPRIVYLLYLTGYNSKENVGIKEMSDIDNKTKFKESADFHNTWKAALSVLIIYVKN